LLGIANVDLARGIALDFVDNADWDPADVAILAGFRRGSAVAIYCSKIELFDVFDHLGREELTLEDVAHVRKTVVGH
jgi:hypothetical protein